MSTPLPATVSNERVRACADKFLKELRPRWKRAQIWQTKTVEVLPCNVGVWMAILLRDFTSGNGWVAKDIECFVVLFASRCLQKRRVNHNIFSNHASIIIYQSRIKITWEARCWYEVVREVSRAVGQSCTKRSAEHSQKEPEIPKLKMIKVAKAIRYRDWWLVWRKR